MVRVGGGVWVSGAEVREGLGSGVVVRGGGQVWCLKDVNRIRCAD